MGRYGNSERIVGDCERQRAQLWQEFDRVKGRLEEIARYVYPAALPGFVRDIRDMASSESDYDEDDAERLTDVPFDAFKVAVSGFYTNLTNPSAPWFRLGSPTFGETSENDTDAYARSYAAVTDATRWLIGWSNAYRALHTCYKHLVAFGFAAIVASEDRERIVNCQCLRVGTYALGIDRKGKVDRLVRHFAFTAPQLIEEFGSDNVSPSVLEAARRGDVSHRYEVWNLVEPHRRLKGVDSPYSLSFDTFVYRSTYWSSEAGSQDERGLLAVRGFRVKPLVAPRLAFELGDIYGRGCGANVLGHCRALQTMALAQLDIADHEAHPSMMAPSSMADDGLRLGPYEVNFYPDGLPPNAVYRTLGQPVTGERTAAEMARLENEIRKEFFNSEFETINALEDNSALAGSRGDRMTATEVKARVSEKMEQLAGIATTLNDELLDPFVTMMAAYALLARLVDVSLPEGAGTLLPWDIKYESAIHAAVNTQPINAASTALGIAMQFAQAANDPTVIDNFDADTAARDIHRKLGAPERYLRSVDERDELRAKRAEEAMRQQQVQEQAIQAKALKDVASAPVSPETIGGAIAGNQGGLA